MKQSFSRQILFRISLLLSIMVMVMAQPAQAVRNLKIGDPLPSFFLPRADGTTGLYPSEQLIGQPAAIIFWRPDHRFSMDALRDLETAAKEIGLHKFKVLVVDAKLSTVPDVRKALANEAVAFPVVLDPQRALYEKVGLIVCPTTLLFDEKGILRFVVASHARQFRQVVKARLRFLLGEIDEQTMNEQIKPANHHIKPDLAAAWRMYNLGVQLQAEGKHGEAASMFERTINQYPPLAEAHCALGFLKFSAGQMNEAGELFETALKHNPKLPQAQLGHAIVLARSGRDENAEQILITLLGHRTLAARARYELGRIYAARGDRDKALTFFQDALALIFPEPVSAGDSASPRP